MMQQFVMFRGGEWKTCKGAIDGVREDICLLLRNQEGKLSFLLKDVLHMSLCCFKVDF